MKSRLFLGVIITAMIFSFAMVGCDNPTDPDVDTVKTPSFDPHEGNYSSPQSVSISCSTSSARIYYTTNGSEPTEHSAEYLNPITVSSTTTLLAKAFKSGWKSSNIASATYTISNAQVATPTFNPPEGNYTSAQSVTISCATDGATIRYTTNGDDPNSSSQLYSTSINIATNTTLKARAFKTGFDDSSVASGTYTISLIQVATPTLFYFGEPFTGDLMFPFAAILQCATYGAQIRYTLNGSEPTESSPLFDGEDSSSIYLVTDGVVKAKAYKTGMSPSNTLVAPYQIQYEEVGTCEVSLAGTGRIIVADGFAYIPGNNLQIINVQNPSQPSVASSFSGAGFINDICLVGNYIYASGYEGLSIIDVTNKYGPILKGQCDADPEGMNWSGIIKGTATRAFIAFGSPGISLFNVNDKTNPYLLDYDQYSVRDLDLKTQSNTIYYCDGIGIGSIAANSNYLSFGNEIYDTSNRNLSIYGNYLYSSGWSDISIFDTSSSSQSPVYSGDPGSYYISPEYSFTFAKGNHIYTKYANSSLILVCQGTLSPVMESRIYNNGRPRSIFVTDSYIYLHDENRGFRVIQAPN